MEKSRTSNQQSRDNAKEDTVYDETCNIVYTDPSKTKDSADQRTSCMYVNAPDGSWQESRTDASDNRCSVCDNQQVEREVLRAVEILLCKCRYEEKGYKDAQEDHEGAGAEKHEWCFFKSRPVDEISSSFLLCDIRIIDERYRCEECAEDNEAYNTSCPWESDTWLQFAENNWVYNTT